MAEITKTKTDERTKPDLYPDLRVRLSAPQRKRLRAFIALCQARKRERAMQELADQAQELGMGY